MLPKPLARRVVAAARRFYDREPWQEFTDEFLFAFEVPGEPLPIFAIVLGAGGREFGLSMYRGERALEQLHLVTSGPRPPFIAPMLLLSFDPVGAVVPEFRELTRLAGHEARVIPTVLSIPAGGRARPAAPADLRLVAQIVEAMLLADDQDLLRPRMFNPMRGGKVLTLKITGEGGKVRDVTAHFANVDPVRIAELSATDLPWPLSELPLADRHLVVGFEPSPIGVADDENRPWLLLVVDPVADQIVGMKIVPLDEPDDLDDAVHAFAKILAAPEHAAMPRRLTIVHERLARSLANLTNHGVELEVAEEHASLHNVLEGLRDHLAKADGEGEAAPPAGDDERRWRLYHQRLVARVDAALENVDLYPDRALAAFFGDAEVYDELDELEVEMHDIAYRDWFLTHYRGKASKGKAEPHTVAERMLAGSLPATERCLLQARIAAQPGLWVISAVQAPTVSLRDVFTGREVEVNDGGLAASAFAGEALPASVADANGHLFLIPIGPRIPPLQLDLALADLEESFGPIRSDDLRNRPQMLASLWEWALDLEATAQVPRLVNTDGDELQPQTATFSVADWFRLTDALGARDDIETETEDRWVWLRRSATGNTILASLERVVDELLVDVNSARRLTALRSWLEAIAGVSFEGAREADGDDLPRRGQASLSSADLTPESLADLQAHVDALTMQWLDERVPALGNKTPREAVRTPEGRQAVLHLIRSWPDPVGMPGARTPRERLRRELGLPETDEGAAL